MKRSLLLAASAAMLIALVPTVPLRAQDTPPAATSPEADLQALISSIKDKLRQGANTEAALADEIRTFDTLLAKYRDQKTDAVAQILFMKGTLYVEVFDQPDIGLKIIEQVKTDFPDTKIAGNIDRVVGAIKKRMEATKAKTALVGQPAPELHFTWATRSDLTTLSSLRGKVVVLDFWATWCGPCVASFPQIKELTERYRGYDVEIIGVTSLQGRVHGLEPQPIDCRDNPTKEKELMPAYVTAKDITWTIAFSEEQVFNAQYGVSGIPHMTIVGPDGTVRHNGIHPGGVPLAEKAAMIDALLKEAGLRTPAAL
jgi:thiol-disulfide isomerase/thioredoxin